MIYVACVTEGPELSVHVDVGQPPGEISDSGIFDWEY